MKYEDVAKYAGQRVYHTLIGGGMHGPHLLTTNAHLSRQGCVMFHYNDMALVPDKERGWNEHCSKIVSITPAGDQRTEE